MITAMSFREITAEQLDALLLRKDSWDVKIDCGRKITEIEQGPRYIHKADYLKFHLGQKNPPPEYH